MFLLVNLKKYHGFIPAIDPAERNETRLTAFDLPVYLILRLEGAVENTTFLQ